MAFMLFLFQAVPVAGMAAEVSGGAAVEVVAHFQSVLLSMMRDAGGLSFRGRFERLEPEVKQSHDLPGVARLSTGRYWRSLDEQQQSRFVDTFTRLVIATYAHQFKTYDGEAFKRKSVRLQKHGRILVRTELVKSNGKSVHLDYVLHYREGRWSIINIIADGVSDLALKRAEYSHVLAREGLHVLVSMLERKITQYRSHLQKSEWIRCNPTLSGFPGWIEGHGGSMPRRFNLEIRRSGEVDCRSRLLQVAHR